MPPAIRSRRASSTAARAGCVRRALKIAFRATLAIILVIAVYVAVTIYPYLSGPGTDSVAARVAEWARDRHFSWAVS